MNSAADDVDALLRQGESYFNAGNLPAAEEAFAQAAQRAPLAWQVHFNLGLCRERQGKWEPALLAFEAANRLLPDHVPVLTSLAVCAFHLGHTDLALQLTLRQVELEPTNPLAYDNLGQIFRQQGQHEAAELSFRNALLLNPALPAVRNNLGIVLQDQGKLEDAEAAFREVLAQDPTHADACVNLAGLCLRQEKPKEAIALYRRAVASAPGAAVAWTNLGNALKADDDCQEALEAYRKAVELAPRQAWAHWNYGVALLTTGQLLEGWSECEWGAAAGVRTAFSDRLPAWKGESLAGRRLLLRAEQGLGDTLQCLRFIPRLQGGRTHITLECQPALMELAKNVAGISRVVPQQDHGLPADAYSCDLYLSLMSLPHMLGIGLADLPGPAPYLRTPANRTAAWQSALGPRQRLRVGLVWRGNPSHPNDRQRSCLSADLAPILAVPEVEFFSLQLGADRQSLPSQVHDLTSGISDFTDTAAILENLDLLISVDTAIVHLAGALGRPAWLMLSHDADWRWLRQRSDSPWYPSLTLYRQKLPGQWLPVAEALAADLDRLAANRG